MCCSVIGRIVPYDVKDCNAIIFRVKLHPCLYQDLNPGSSSQHPSHYTIWAIPASVRIAYSSMLVLHPCLLTWSNFVTQWPTACLDHHCCRSLCGVDRQFLTSGLGQLISPIFRGQAVPQEYVCRGRRYCIEAPYTNRTAWRQLVQITAIVRQASALSNSNCLGLVTVGLQPFMSYDADK